MQSKKTECPFCGSSNITVISEIKSKKHNSEILKTLQYILGIIILLMSVSILINSNKSFEAIEYIINGKASIAETLDISAQLVSNIAYYSIYLKILKACIYSILILGIVRIILPYQIYSTEKFICIECRHKWDIKEPTNNQTPSQ